MADNDQTTATATTETPKTTTNAVVSALTPSNHPKISAAVFAGAVTNLVIAIAKAHGHDLSGQEGNIILVVMGVVGYLAPNEGD